MIRDPGPVLNVGHSVTSRDIPTNTEETEGISPNSGILTRAVSGNPVLKFFSSAAVTMVGAYAASKLTRAGGLRLAKTIQDKATVDADKFSTTIVKSVTELRRHLDELQGLTRIGGDRAYSDLVWEMDGKLTTGIDLDGRLQETSGVGFLKANEIAGANEGILREPAAVWSFRDTLQQKMVRAGRRLPYELPAFYAAQKAIVDPLFGEKISDEKKVNWANPVDVITDFTKESVIAAATMILPFEFAGAAATQTRSSLHTARHSSANLARLTPIQQKMHKGFVELDEVTKLVGHPLSSLQDRFLKTSARASGAFSAVADPYRNQQGFVQNLRSLRHGYNAAKKDIADRAAKGEQVKNIKFTDLFSSKTLGPESSATAFDLIPGMSGLPGAIKTFKETYKIYGDAYDVVSGKVNRNRLLKKRPTEYESPLDAAIDRLQSSSRSRFVDIVGSLGSQSAKNDYLSTRIESDIKKSLETNLRRLGFSESDSLNFVKNINVDQGVLKAIASAKDDTVLGVDPTKLITMGSMKNYGIPGSKKINDVDSFFENILVRYGSISKDSEIAHKIGARQLRKTVQESFEDVADRVNNEYIGNVYKEWGTIRANHIGQIGSEISGKNKLSYLSVKERNPRNVAAVQKAVGRALGLNDASDRVLRNALIRRGFDPDDFNGMRSFLLRNRKMSSGLFSRSSGLGQKVYLRDITDAKKYEDLDYNLKQIVSQEKFESLQGFVQKSNTGGSAMNTSLEQTAISGLRKRVSKNGAVSYLDYSGVKGNLRSAANFFMDEFKIPVLGFNPFNLFGKSSFNAMANSSPVQVISGRSVQPFASEIGADDFAVFVKTKAAKGRVIKVSGSDTGGIKTNMLDGYYRPVHTSSNELLSRYARNASGVRGESPYQTAARFEGRDNLTIPERIKQAFDVDIENQGSIGGFINRFRGRAFDLENPTTLSKLLRGDAITSYRGGRKTVLKGRVNGAKLDIVDESTGKVVKSLSEQDVFKGLDSLRRSTDKYGISSRVVEAAEADKLFSDGLELSGVNSASGLRKLISDLADVETQMLDKQGISKTQQKAVQRSRAKINRMIDAQELSALSSKAADSPTITTAFDDIITAVFRHRMSTEGILAAKAGKPDPFVRLNSVLDDLVQGGRISSAQRAESKASILGALIDKAAFSTYSPTNSVSRDARNAFTELINNRQAFEHFSEPFSSGSINGITGGVKKRLSPLTSKLNGRFTTGKHSMRDFYTDPLGSGQQTTLVPTFGTVFSKSPMGAIKSAAGLTTYSDPGSYSNASAAVAHSVGRLNGYFSAAGVGIKGDYSGPLSEFAIGMVGKRVLPAYIAGMTFITADRTVGGMVNEKDDEGERVYSPFLVTKAARAAVEVQSVFSGITPGGPGYQEKREELLEGEVAIRQGRYWPLGFTPFKGGKIEYYRPSYYRRLQAGALYTDDTYGSPIEKFLFYNDISPLRPFDPYRFEKKHYEDRPYPVTGDYFTGPFGPLTTIGNLTIGKILKPRKTMHEAELQMGLANYMPAGQFGAYDASAYLGSNAGYQQPSVPGASMYGAPMGAGQGNMPGGFTQIAQSNAEMASRAGPTGLATGMIRNDISSVNSQFAAMAYGPPKSSGIMTPSIVASGSPISSGSMEYQFGELGYRTQEMAGIYGFALANVRETFGLGQSDLTPQRSVLESASKAYGSTRSFWDLNLGGLGDAPLPSEGIGNLEFSEVVRRFIPKERTDVDFINPIRNRMADEYPFLPGSEYFTNFKTGDPYTKIKEGELRLPGLGYERLNRLYGDETGRYGITNQLDILGDVAPYSKQYRSLNKQIDSMALSPDERIRVAEIREQVESKSVRRQFSDYSFRGSSAEDMGLDPRAFTLGRIGEAIAHTDNFIVNKTIGRQTAVEDWERKNVYGSTFPQWQSPVSSFIAPMVNKATQDNPIVASTSMAIVGSLFGATPRARAFGATAGFITGASASIYGQVKEFATGERHIPMERKKELALEEYVDVLSYVKNSRLASLAQQSGDFSSAVQFRRQAQATMYGSDLDNINVELMKYAVPKRKREHFERMIQETDEGEREKILSTSGRLERRLYQAAWGMRVEKRPELDEYFERHELPDESWEGWHANTNMDHVKIKMGQSMGLDMSQMGYYPQQLKQANLANPSYPSFFSDEDSEDMFLRLKSLMSGMGVSGTVIPVANTFGRQDINISYGV